MNHSTSKILHILDAFLDFFLLLGAYEVSSLLRMHSPWGEAFWWVDVARFRPLALVYAAAIILIYIAQGEYRTFKRRGLVRELAKALLGNLGGFALAATILYVFQLSQFSRLLLVYYYLLSSVVITIKRLLLHRISLWYAKRRHIVARVLLVGNGNLALRYYNDIVKGKDVSAEYAGYAAQNPVVELPNYLGTVADLHKILESTRITHIVIAEETQNRSELLQITAIAENYGIKVSVIPVYSDFLSSRTMDNTVNGLYVIDLKMQETCNIMGVNIVVTDMDKTMTLLESQLEQWRGKYICVANDVVSSLFPDKQKDFVFNISETDTVLVKEIRPDNNTRDMEKLAASIVDTLQGEHYIKAVVGIGTPISNIKDLASSFKEAQIAMEVGKVFDTEKQVISYDHLGIARLIYQLPTTLCEAFLREVFKQDSIDSLDSETLFTIQRFFENNLNVSETSRGLFVHRNTLVYRLEKIKKLTGLDLRKFDDAIVFKVALMVKKYLSSDPARY